MLGVEHEGWGGEATILCEVRLGIKQQNCVHLSVDTPLLDGQDDVGPPYPDILFPDPAPHMRLHGCRHSFKPLQQSSLLAGQG